VVGPLGECPVGRPKREWEDNFEIDLWESGCEDVRWMELARDRVQWWALVLAVLNLRVLLPLSTL
jgi:hypothetical protein